ncbi:MAG: endo alpha-1,4 polygalactosaminidase [Chlorobi bacterium]|nr:endo alpha-1,4 polygalactosaminidase [Chlorobiota bacterium]
MNRLVPLVGILLFLTSLQSCKWKASCKASYTWLYKLGETITDKEIDRKYDYYDIDLFNTSPEQIKRIQDNGGTVICYFSAGTLEDWRPDAGQFPDSVVGNPMEGWEGEYWLDIRSDAVRTIMAKRLDLAVSKGCDGVEPDNLDGWKTNTGFSLTRTDAIDYFKWLAQEAHSRNLKIALKNNGDLVPELLSDLDLAVVEECFAFDECDAYAPITQSGKPVLEVEYELSRNKFCCLAKDLGFSSAKACTDLDGCWKPCF